MARPMGCSDRDSRDAATPSTPSTGTSSTPSTAVTISRPSVRVPVLSNATHRTEASRSRCAPPLMRTPARAAAVSADTMDTGVEMTSAHGQATTSSAIARYPHTDGSPPANTGGTMASSTARTTTAGVYTRANLSTNACTGARCRCACSTSLTMCASVVSDAGRVTRSSIAPEPLIEPAKTSSPGRFSAGHDSPVIGAWLTDDTPWTTVPSSGMRCPGRTTTTSPTATDETGSSRSAPARRTVAVAGARVMSARMACRARSMLRASSHPAMAYNQITVAASSHSSRTRAPTTATTISALMSSTRARTARHARAAGV